MPSQKKPVPTMTIRLEWMKQHTKCTALYKAIKKQHGRRCWQTPASGERIQYVSRAMFEAPAPVYGVDDWHNPNGVYEQYLQEHIVAIWGPAGGLWHLQWHDEDQAGIGWVVVLEFQLFGKWVRLWEPAFRGIKDNHFTR